jgi:hypothetical protein
LPTGWSHGGEQSVDEQIKRFGAPSGHSARGRLSIWQRFDASDELAGGSMARRSWGPTNNLDDAGFRFTGLHQRHESRAC